MGKDDAWTYAPGDKAVYNTYEDEFERERAAVAEALSQIEADTGLPQIHHSNKTTFAAATPPADLTLKGANFGSDASRCFVVVQGNIPKPAEAAGFSSGQATFDLSGVLGTPWYWTLDAGLVTLQVLVLGTGTKKARSRAVSIILT